MYVPACLCVYMWACQVEVRGQHGLSVLPFQFILFYFLLFLTFILILNDFIVIVGFDICMYSRLAGPLDSGDPFSVSYLAVGDPGITDMCCHV